MRFAIVIGATALLFGLHAARAEEPSFRATDCYESRGSVEITTRLNGERQKFEFRPEGIHHFGPPIKVGPGQRIQAHWLFRWKDEVDVLRYGRAPDHTANSGVLTIILLPSEKSRRPDKIDIFAISNVAERCWEHIKKFVADQNIGVSLVDSGLPAQ